MVLKLCDPASQESLSQPGLPTQHCLSVQPGLPGLLSVLSYQSLLGGSNTAVSLSTQLRLQHQFKLYHWTWAIHPHHQ